MKSVWKGSLSFGLVTIPVKLYSATLSHVLGFTLLHVTCSTPIIQKRWCPYCEKTLEWSDIVKGIKRADGSYFIITPDKLLQLRAKKTDRIDILEFIDKNFIEPILLDQHYYAAPLTVANHSYFLFIITLQHMDKVAIGRVVVKDKEYICVLQPFHQVLLLTTLNYFYEIRSLVNVKELQITDQPKFSTAEINLAKQLIKNMTVKKFDITKFNDNYTHALIKLINTKPKKHTVRKQKMNEIAVKKTPKNHTSLLSDLKKSIQQWDQLSSVHQSPMAKAAKSTHKVK